MIVCLARPELLDIRPGWGGGRLRQRRSRSSRSRRRRPRSWSTRCSTITSLARRAPHAAGEDRGQPALRRGDDADAARGRTRSKRIPDTLQAIIAARIDRLPVGEKRLLQRASVIGRIFWRRVQQLVPDLDNLEPVLDDLLLRDFIIRESRSSITGEYAHRFKHVLIRDVAYASLAKAARGAARPGGGLAA